MKYKCSVCGGEEIGLVWEDGDFKIFVCRRCNFGYLEPYFSLRDAKKIYDDGYFIEKRDDQHYLDALHKFNFLKDKVQKGARILDFGCGNGEFVYVCKEHGMIPFGYDISPFSSTYVRKTYGVPTTSANLRGSLYKSNFFDAIVAFDVIEHAPNYRKIVKYFYRWLKPGGCLLAATPNICSWDRRLLGKHWYGFTKVPQHINYFSPKSIRLVLAEGGFTKAEIRGWGFVRSLGFIQKNLVGRNMLPKKLADISFFVPMINMMVIAEK